MTDEQWNAQELLAQAEFATSVEWVCHHGQALDECSNECPCTKECRYE